MSIQEMKQELQTLTPAERAELKAHLRLLDLKDDPVRLQELADAHERADAGAQVSGAEVLRLIGHPSLSKK